MNRRFLLYGIPVVVLAALAWESTSKPLAALVVVVVLGACLLGGAALNARHDRRTRTGRPDALAEARAQLDVPLVHAARKEHGESAGITEIRRQVPSLTLNEAVELHRYV